MKTKKEIRNTLKCEISMNRISDSLINKAVDSLNEFYKDCKTAYTYSIKEIVDEAYDLQVK